MSLPRGGAPAAALAAIERSIAEAWTRFVAERGGDEEALAVEVLADPSAHPWRVVDAAMDRVPCERCGAPTGAGPRDCRACEVADGFRYAAREHDRPGVPRGNEHALRVATNVARHRHRFTPTGRCGYELALPHLLAGELPARRDAHALKSAINGLSPDELETVTSWDEVRARVAPGRSPTL